ncbi:MAG TPA: PilZ domain-containing protein [Polyangiaceae bacterium]|nr:PilZ domain-containing protein [Polyangiaceae bacterium]
MQELRRHPRKPVRTPVTVLGPEGARVEGHSRDLSIGGMFIEAPASFRFGTSLRVELALPLVGVVALPAVVRWVTPEGIGVQFGLLGARETHAITALVARSSVPSFDP